MRAHEPKELHVEKKYYRKVRGAEGTRLAPIEGELETSFRVQQCGAFVGGLATVQCMYAPEFTAHSGTERVEVKSPLKNNYSTPW